MLTPDQKELFATTGFRTPRENFTWPNLVGHKMEVSFDCETTGLDVYGADLPVGFGIIAGGRSDQVRAYLAWGHASGPYLDREACLQWARENLLDGNKTVLGANLKFDFKMMRKLGVDFEGKCKHRDVQHEVALIDPNRQRKNLDLISRQYLGRGKIDPGIVPIHLQSSAVIERYCLMDCELVWDLDNLVYRKVVSEGLQKVFEMEQELTWAVIHMEDNGLLTDVDKLAQWREKARRRQIGLMMELNSMAGFNVHPGRALDVLKLFNMIGVDSRTIPRTPKAGKPSFPMEFLEQHDHPLIAKLRDVKHLKSFREKYLDKYWDALQKTNSNILRYSLHQLNAEEGGTVTGRFSASAPSKDGSLPGMNPQQVFKVKEQKKIAVIADMLTRDLFIEEEPREFFSADASQIEYRFFGHYVNDDAVTAIYKNNPEADFHQVFADELEVDRDTVAKHANFAVLFGAGLDKFAWMIGKPVEEAKVFWDKYHRKFPGVRWLSRETQAAAERRGFIRTILGRRRSLKGEEWKALNTLCQGSAADYVKLTTIDLYKSRKDLGINLRCVIHDEPIGGLQGNPAKLLEFLNQQRLDLRVPITWGLKTGRSWNI